MAKIEPFKPIEWEASMATGIAAIDKQHKYLIDTLQSASQTPLTDDDVDLLNKVTKDLLGYAITHFETEEALMQHYGYAEARPEEARVHIAQHREFSRQVVTVHEQLREGQKVSRIEVLRFLNHWLRDHILGVDQLLGKYLVKQSGHESKI